jgi:predicted ATPase
LQPKRASDTASLDDVSIKLLGGFAVFAGGEPLTDVRWRLRKGRDLVKLLALAPGHRLHREQLMDALWPNSEPAAAANNLNQVVHAARRVLGADRIELRDELLTLRADVDVDDFELAAAHARRTRSPPAYRAALSLYAGELLPENRYDEWALARREELEELHGELEGQLGARGGERTFGFPAQASSFVGRDRELRELASLLRGTRLLTLAGAGGVGKTRLALELARRTDQPHTDGVAFVELASVGAGNLVAGAVASALDIGALPGRTPLEATVDYLAPRRLLLVLDNCEHVLAASATLCDALLRAAPDLKIIATTREPLRIDGEVVFRVPSLAIPDPERGLEAPELMRYEAVRLLAERAAAAVPGFEVDADNARDIARICFRLDGLPLALELAAARLGALGTAALAERLDDLFMLLRTGSRAAPTRQQTLLATLQWSYDLLLEEEKLLLRRVAVFTGGFELAAAEAACSGGPLEPGAIADVLARLVEKSLVSTNQSGRERRYRLLETVRLYALERLDDTDERAAAAARHAQWALTIAEKEGDSPRLDREAANLRAAHQAMPAADALRYCVALLPFWMRRIDLEEAHQRFVDALAAAPERTELRAAALLAMSAIDYRAGTLACGEAHAREGYEIAARLGPGELRWRALQRVGEFAVSRDDATQAAILLERARRLAQRNELAAAEALSIYALGVVRWLVGDLTGAEAQLRKSVRALRATPSAPACIQSPLNVAEMRPGDGSSGAELRIVFEETLQPFMEISYEAAIAYMLTNQATIARLRGQPNRAQALLDEASERFRRTGDQRGQAAVLVRRAYLELSRSSRRQARDHLEDALEMRRRLGEVRGVGMALQGLGLVATLEGDHDLAERQLAEAREIFRRAGDRWGLVSSLWRTADLALARGRLGDAETAVEEAREVVGETERRGWIDVTVAMQAEVAKLRGDDARAAALFAQAREGYVAAADAAGVAAIDAHAQSLAKDRQSGRKAGPSTTKHVATTRKRRKT